MKYVYRYTLGDVDLSTNHSSATFHSFLAGASPPK